MKKISTLLALIMILTMATLTGCDGKPDEAEGDGEWRVALVAAGLFGDDGLNDALLDAANRFTAATDIPVTSVETTVVADHAIHARNFGEAGYDLVIMGGPVSEFMPEILEDFPNTHYVLNKGTVDGFSNVTSIQFEEPQAGFIGGAFAVMMSEYLDGGNRVGWIGGMRISDLEMCRFSFMAGAHYMGGEAVTTYVGDFQDIARAMELALQMYGDGMVIVQAFAGGAANGVYQAVETLPSGHFAMGAATGQFHLSPDRILASHIIRTDEYFADVMTQFIEGRLPSGLIYAGLEEGATGIRISPLIGDRIPQDIKDRMAEIERQIIAGEIVPPTDEDAFDAFVALHG